MCLSHFSLADLKFISQRRSMHLQYILSCSSLSVTQLSRPMESKIDPDQWEAVYTLFAGMIRMWTALLCPGAGLCRSVEAAGCRVLFQLSSGVPEKGRRWKAASKEQQIGGVTVPDLGLLLIKCCRCKEDNFQALWRRRRIPKTKKISLEIQAKRSAAWRLQNRKSCKKKDWVTS